MTWPRSWLAFLPPSRMAAFRPWLQAIVAVFCINLVVGGFWTYPRWQAVQPRRQEAQRIAEARERVGPALARARRTHGWALEAREDLEALRKLIGRRSGTISEAVEALRRVVVDVGLGITRVDYRVESIDELGLLELQTKLPVTGSYGSVQRLISTLGADGPFVAIDRIALSSTDAPRGVDPLSVELDLSAFVLESMPPPPVGPQRPDADGDRADAQGSPAAVDDPWGMVEEVRERLESLQPLSVPPEGYAVRLSRLHERAPRHHGVTRNLFAFEAAAGAPNSHDQAPPPAQVPEPTPTPQPPAPPRVPYELIGILDMGNGRLATLTDGSDLYVVGADDTLPGDVKVVSVGIDYMELEVRGARVRLTLESGTP